MNNEDPKFNVSGKWFDDIINKINAIIPPSLKSAREDLEKNIRQILQTSFTKLDLVTRKEFDTQVHVLAKTRAKLEELEKHILEIEKKLSKRGS